MKKFNNLVNKILNEFKDDNNILEHLKTMDICPYGIKIKNNRYNNISLSFFNCKIDVNRYSTAEFDQYHFYYRLYKRFPQYSMIDVQQFIFQAMNLFLNNKKYKKYWNNTEYDNYAFTILSKSHNDFKIKCHIFKYDNLKNSEDFSIFYQYQCILNTILYIEMVDEENDKPDRILTVTEDSSLLDFNSNNIITNFSFPISNLLVNDIFINTIPIIIP